MWTTQNMYLSFNDNSVSLAHFFFVQQSFNKFSSHENLIDIV